MQVTPYYIAPIDFPAMTKPATTREVVARNLATLMGLSSWRQTELAKRSGVSQKTISNMLNPGQGVESPKLDKVEAVAAAFGLHAWHLLLPAIPPDRDACKALTTLVENFAHSSEEGRAHIARTAAMERKIALG